MYHNIVDSFEVYRHTIMDSDVTMPHVKGQININRMQISKSIEGIIPSCKLLLGKVLLKFSISRMPIKPASYQVATDGVVYHHEMPDL